MTRVGISFEGDYKDKTSTIRQVNFLGTICNYDIIHILEFDSDRKRMSVIVRCHESNELLLLSKGAEDSIFSQCISGSVKHSNQILRKFALNGWRTLAFAYKVINEEEFRQFTADVKEAMNDLNNRDELLKSVYENMEKNLILVGTTAVEDRLQEDVAATLVALRTAGIKIWVLTGDKMETAVNISNTCRHFSPQMKIFSLKNLDTAEDISKQFASQKKM